ncbi:outer membrane receptor for ferrienterochelin and colicins [Sphingobacterium paludis]|uniref:Outer membrane receptor for ferrienterochelin and colicins n=2 Tax=Sphingobacterium paludis TaxID=1476465 RepID=A0A4R7CUG8_9SPHI|nr:outer membrane receptor for ferrienterochelin and colicins [Sphingobacterium paludis]
MANIQVTLFPDRMIVHTDTTGFFSFPNLYSGTYQLEARQEGFTTAVRSVALENVDTLITLHVNTEGRRIDTVLVNGKVAAVDNLVRAESAAMPVKIITRREIELMGSRRLDEVMKEQTGVAVVNDIAGGSRAVGVQVQGFSSNYVMVLIDGQPMMGRNNGNFDLSRISVTNIERIEIIKGATSCLYGSDALGGAINIVTRHGALTPQAQASILYGSLNIVDATLEAETPFAHQRGSVVVSGNYYRTNGFNSDRQFLDNESTTFPPYENYSFQGRGRYRTSKSGTIGLTSRYAARQSTMFNSWSDNLRIEDRQEDQELSVAGSYDHVLSSTFRSMSRYYYTRFHTQLQAAWLQQNIVAGAESFGQQAHRIEQQFAYTPMQVLKFTGGIGAGLERMDEQSLDERRSLHTAFAFLQTEWKATDRLLSTLGIRYDYSNVYDGRLSPSFGLQYQLRPSLLLKAGVGAGFKAPDYKMRYQVFYNPAANYLVVGSDRVQEIIAAMDASGEISYRNTYMLNVLANNLKAEKSLSNNVGLSWSPSTKLQVDASVFYHRINDQINTVIVANGTSIASIFSYRNLPKAVNKGFEVSATYQASSRLQFSAGYQYLIAKDLAMLDSIRAGRYPYNQYNNAATGEYRESRPSDYWGIEDRSRHMLNLKALYSYQPWGLNLNVRANIRGRYPFQDINGNQFIDDADAFVPWHTLLNLTLEKSLLNRRLIIRVVGDNLLNFTNRNMLGQPGRVLLAGLSYRWMKD